MRVGETIVYLHRSAEFKRCFLKLFVFQQCLAASDVLGLGFFGRGAGADDQGDSQEGKKQSYGVEVSAALSIFHYGGSP